MYGFELKQIDFGKLVIIKSELIVIHVKVGLKMNSIIKN